MTRNENEIFKVMHRIYTNKENRDQYGQVGISNYTETTFKYHLTEESFKFLKEGKSKYGKLSTYGGRFGTYTALNPTSEFYQKCRESK